MNVTDVQDQIGADRGALNSMSLLGHEEVLFCNDEKTGLKAIIAVHNTVLGPALGGTRMWQYANEFDALEDVLRLSRGMTYKAAVTGLNLGGGKAVILGNSRTDKTEALLRRFGKFVDDLGGKYITAEDVGMTSKDMEYIRMQTRHVSGLPESLGGSGNPSPVTAYGVYMGMKASAKYAYGNDNLAGKKILVQGAGNVGQNLIELLLNENAEVLVTDIFEDKLAEVSAKYPKAKIVDSDNFFELEFDIYAPCALGATVNSDSIEKMKCSIIAGAANNQLKDEKLHAKALMNKGIVYAPDFLINAGGLINVFMEYMGGYQKKNALAQTENIYSVTLNLLKKAQNEDITTTEAAKRIAEDRINSIAHIKTSYNR